MHLAQIMEEKTDLEKDHFIWQINLGAINMSINFASQKHIH